MGIQIGLAGAWRSVGTVDVLPEDIGERILFEDGGIFYIDDEGVKRRGFMYKAAFYFRVQGRISQPKFHVCKCTLLKTSVVMPIVSPMQSLLKFIRVMLTKKWKLRVWSYAVIANVC